jgi:EAL domain-containing protein (putative c-di-GMP-specific phosphodiesterase class I)
MAMYEAKRRGRGTYAFFDDQMRERAIDRGELERDFVHAIANDEIVVHYQPKINLVSGSIEGYEALVRWAHPERGLLYPGSFLDVVGTGDGLERIGRKVMSIVASDIPKLRASGISCHMAVNVCPTQFAEDDFAERLTDYVKALGVEPDTFELEVTEAVAMLDVDKARKHLLALKRAGFKLSIDDFGMGFSNLSQLSRLPYDSLKIDRSLISDIVTNHDSRIIVSAIISMAHGLGHTVVAEGVETAAQFEILRVLGCDTVQGYYLGMPVAFQELIAGCSNPAERRAAVG